MSLRPPFYKLDLLVLPNRLNHQTKRHNHTPYSKESTRLCLRLAGPTSCTTRQPIRFLWDLANIIDQQMNPNNVSSSFKFFR